MDVAKSTWLHFLVSWDLICPGCYGTRGTNATLRTSSLGLTMASRGPALWVEEEAAKAETLVLAQRPTRDSFLHVEEDIFPRSGLSLCLRDPCPHLSFLHRDEEHSPNPAPAQAHRNV